jgi:methylated-DNA-protein-cysteine methyltransferase-like protein
LVGYALASIPDGLDVPWQRVINSQGRISFHGGGFFSDLQRKMLIAEGICFSREGKVNLQRYGWRP